MHSIAQQAAQPRQDHVWRSIQESIHRLTHRSLRNKLHSLMAALLTGLPVQHLIPVDALYSPVRQVAYKVENTREGQVLDYDKLTKVARTVHATAVAVGNAPARPKVDGKARD